MEQIYVALSHASLKPSRVFPGVSFSFAPTLVYVGVCVRVSIAFKRHFQTVFMALNYKFLAIFLPQNGPASVLHRLPELMFRFEFSFVMV